MAKKLDKNKMAEAVAQAAEGGQPLHARLANAQQVLARQPTGYHPEQPAAAPADAVPGIVFQNLDDDGVGRKTKFARVSRSLVDHNPYNARRIYKQEKINNMAASLRAEGQLVPCIGTIRDGRCILIAGHYRDKAAEVAGIETLDFMIHENLTDHQLYEMSYIENADREEQTPLDNALVWRDLLEQGLYKDETAISKATNQSLSNVNKTMSILKLSDSIIEVVKERPEAFALSALYELHLLEKAAGPGKDVAFEMAKKIWAGEAGRTQCTEARAKIESPKDRKTKEVSRQYKIHQEGEHVGTLKDWDSGKVLLEIQVQNPAERAKLVDELKKRFGLGE